MALHAVGNLLFEVSSPVSISHARPPKDGGSAQAGGCITFFPQPPTITFRSIASTARVFRLPPVISSGKRHCFRSVASAFSPSAFVVASRQRLLALRPHSACNCFAKLGVIGTYNSPYFPVVSGFPVHVAPLQEDMIQKSIWLLDFGDGANPT